MTGQFEDYMVLHVPPRNHEKLPEERRLDFADYDLMTPPPVLVMACLFFPLLVEIDKDKIVADVKEGYAHALEKVPVFAGKLQTDQDGGRFYCLQKKSDTNILVVNHLDGKGSTFPSLAQWKKAGYPDTELLAYRNQLFPSGTEPSDLPMGIRVDDGCPMGAAQITFIPGGIVISSVFHHFQGDAMSIDMFCTYWSEASKAFGQGSLDVSIFNPSFDRTYFTQPKTVPDKERVQHLMRILKAYQLMHITQEDLREEKQPESIPGVGPASSPPPPNRAQLEIVSRMLHFPPSSCERLKTLCRPLDPNKYVSTYDCLVAIIHRAMIRARIPMHPEWDTSRQTTAVTSAVNLRDRLDVVPNTYIGNGMALSRTQSVPIDNLLSQSISNSASASRTSILEVLQEDSVPAALAVAKAVEGTHKLQLNSSFHLGPDLLATSWTKMKVYEYDFGFGLPDAFRVVPPPYDGGLALYPRCTRRGETEGFEVCVMLEKNCSDRMLLDPELLDFCEIRGIGTFER